MDEFTLQLIEQAFKAGYHCHWTGYEYVFDPAYKPGDPEGAFKAYLNSLCPTCRLPKIMNSICSNSFHITK